MGALLAVVVAMVFVVGRGGDEDEAARQPDPTTTAPDPSPTSAAPVLDPPATTGSPIWPDFLESVDTVDGPAVPGPYTLGDTRFRLGSSFPVALSHDEDLLYVRAGLRLGVLESAGGVNLLDAWAETPAEAAVDTLAFSPAGEVAAIVVLPDSAGEGRDHLYRGRVLDDGRFAAMLEVPVPFPTGPGSDGAGRTGIAPESVVWSGPDGRTLEIVAAPVVDRGPAVVPTWFRSTDGGPLAVVDTGVFGVDVDGAGHRYWLDGDGRLRTDRPGGVASDTSGHAVVDVFPDGRRVLLDGSLVVDLATGARQRIDPAETPVRTTVIDDAHLLMAVVTGRVPRWFLVELADAGVPCATYEACSAIGDGAVRYSEFRVRPSAMLVRADLATAFTWTTSTAGAALDRYPLVFDG